MLIQVDAQTTYPDKTLGLTEQSIISQGRGLEFHGAVHEEKLRPIPIT